MQLDFEFARKLKRMTTAVKLLFSRFIQLRSKWLLGYASFLIFIERIQNRKSLFRGRKGGVKFPIFRRFGHDDESAKPFDNVAVKQIIKTSNPNFQEMELRCHENAFIKRS
jgi:hypothetical protein